MPKWELSIQAYRRVIATLTFSNISVQTFLPYINRQNTDIFYLANYILPIYSVTFLLLSRFHGHAVAEWLVVTPGSQIRAPLQDADNF